MKDWKVIIFFVSLILILMVFAKKIKKALSRGYINKNPGNIRLNGEHWRGEVEPSRDKEFKEFVTMGYGYRAMFVLLNTYFEKGLNTVEKIISTYAPASENKTEGYIFFVCLKTGFTKNIPLSYNEETIKKLIAAISYFENGIEPDLKEINLGFSLYNSE